MKINYKDIVQRIDLVIDEHIEKGTVEHLKSIELDKNESLQLARYRDLMPASGNSLVYKGVLVIIHESLAQSFDCEEAQAQALDKAWRGTHNQTFDSEEAKAQAHEKVWREAHKMIV